MFSRTCFTRRVIYLFVEISSSSYTAEVSIFVELTKDLPLDVRFIEMMPFDANNWDATKMVTYLEIIDNLKEGGIELNRVQSSDRNDTTKWYRAPDYAGRVGFITSMSQNFCGTCNRLRITTDGKLKVCLFGEESYSIRDSLRAGLSDLEIAEEIGKGVQRKKKVLGADTTFSSENEDLCVITPELLAKKGNRPMILIGG